MNKKLRSMLALVLGVITAGSLVACNPTDDSDKGYQRPTPQAGKYTYYTYTTVSPSNWNELTYQDNNDTQIMSYIGSPLFEFDFKFDGNGDIVPGDFDVEYSFATALTDLSNGAGTKWEIQIREDGKWDDGTPITANDFVYTMEQQLDPLFKNYRADSFYNGATVIKNARNYVFQGETVAMLDNGDVGYVGSIDDLTKDANGVYSYEGTEIKFAVKVASSWGSDYSMEELAAMGYLDATAVASLVALCDENGYAPVTDETIALVATAINTEAWGNEPAENFVNYIHLLNYVYPEMEFDQVGISATDDYTLVLELEQPLHLLNADGTLSYRAAYNMASLPLVKESLYEDCKQDPVAGSTLYTSNYNSSLATTASWGPYKLTSFQAGKWYTLEKNEHWYGWQMEKYEGQYQTDMIVCETIAEYNTAFMMFLKGQLNGIGIDVSVATDYKNSDQAYFTPDDYVGSLQLQSSAEGLRERETAGVNKTILLQEDFRKALSLGLNRDAYAKATTTASLKGLGLFNSMHYYDVANGGAYRETDDAKRVLCEVYGVDASQYDNLDAAVDSITAYDLVQAKALVDSAVAKAIEAGDLKADANGNVTDKVVLTWGTSTDNEVTRRYFDNLSAQWAELMEGTKLEGKFELEFDSSYGTKWADDFRAGAYDICQGGWSGAAWDPGYFLLAYLSPAYMYSAAWDTSSHMMEFTIKGVNADGVVTNVATDTYTDEMSLMEWYTALNGAWKSGALNEEFRLALIAALEKEVLLQYYSVPVTYSFAASLISYQADYITYEYNTFMGYGGIQYMTYNYDDLEWDNYVKANAVNGELNYR